jgi:hypothetical protein
VRPLLLSSQFLVSAERRASLARLGFSCSLGTPRFYCHQDPVFALTRSAAYLPPLVLCSRGAPRFPSRFTSCALKERGVVPHLYLHLLQRVLGFRDIAWFLPYLPFLGLTGGLRL